MRTKEFWKDFLLEAMLWIIACFLCVLTFSCSPNTQAIAEEDPTPEVTQWVITSDSVAFDNIKRSERTMFRVTANNIIHTDQLGEYTFDIKERDTDGTLHVHCECNQKDYKMIINGEAGTWGLRMINPERTIFFHIVSITKRPW